MSLKTKGFIFNLLAFSLIYLPAYFGFLRFSWFESIWCAVGAALVASLLAPKFQTVQTQTGLKLFMSWIFMKGVKEIK